VAHVHSALAGLDAHGLGAQPQQYRALARQLAELPAEVHLPRLFQTDLVTVASHATLSRRVVDDIARGVALLERISPPRVDGALIRFREAFLSRYEGRTMPLAEVLDEECGIGFDVTNDPGADPSPLLQTLDFGADGTEPTLAVDESRQALLLRLWERAVRDNALEIRLTEEDLRLLERQARPAPLEAFSVMARLVARSAQALAQGDFRLLILGIVSASGAQLMGRFCHTDPQLHRYVEAHLRAEEAHAPHAVFAEIVHLPEGRIGNILERPVLRGYEIPFLGRAGAPPERQIPISDLTVAVVSGRIVLHSRRLGCEVMPRLTSAHNYRHRSLGVYRFLCALQHQDRASTLEWSWGPLDAAAFLPRVAVGRFVLTRARWTVWSDQLRALNAKTPDGRLQALQKLRAELRLPRYVELADRDQLLPVDLDNVLCCEALIQLIKGRSLAHLVEMFPSLHESCVTGPEGRFAHELLVPFVRQPGADHTRGRRQPAPAPTVAVRRSFAPGSEWLYAKLYTGASTADSVLRDVVAPVVRRSLSSGAADRWFFLRYGDPHWHLRLRLRGDPRRLHHEVLPALAAAVGAGVPAEKVWRFQLDTYEREIERYGGPDGIELAEAIFCADSEAVLALITTPQLSQDLDVRWRLALCGVDRLLNDFGLHLTGKLQLVQRLREAYGREFQIAAECERQLSVKYRDVRRAVESLVAAAGEPGQVGLPGLDIFRQRSATIAPYIAELKHRERAGRLSQALYQLAASCVHMHTNRLLQSAGRAQECVIYDYLRRCYTSRLARQDTPHRVSELAGGTPSLGEHSSS
jgi:thiopeptide-type bacteriocin biosynthesis protein